MRRSVLAGVLKGRPFSGYAKDGACGDRCALACFKASSLRVAHHPVHVALDACRLVLWGALSQGHASLGACGP